VQVQVCALMPEGEKGWPAFEVALRSALLANPKLKEGIANAPDSALLSVVKCARLGLSLNPADEHFALIPYAGKNPSVQGQVMVRGWLHLMHQSGRLDFLDADLIFQPEVRSPMRLPNGAVNHEPDWLNRDDFTDDQIVGAYAHAKLKGQERYVAAFLSIKEIEKRRKMGQGETPAWREHYHRMCVVKVLKALARSGLIPLSPVARIVAADEDDEEMPAAPTVIQAAPQPVQRMHPAYWDAGQKEQFESLNKDPMPTDEDATEMALGALRALIDQKDATPQDLELVTKHLFKKVVAVDDMTKEQAAKTADYLRKEWEPKQ
jgi:recombinational DNA repair protein RecT